MLLYVEAQLRQFYDMAMTGEPDIWDERGPAFEARGLFALLGRNGNTADTIRRLIDVPPEIEASLRAFARLHPDDGFEIEHMLVFRRRVAEEFERLVSLSMFCESNEYESRESDQLVTAEPGRAGAGAALLAKG